MLVLVSNWLFDSQNRSLVELRAQQGMYTPVCKVVTDLAALMPRLSVLTGKNGEEYCRFDFNVELHFGLTELKAQICWKENVCLFLSYIWQKNFDR